MTVQVGLNIVTLVMCMITLAMATAALLPQIKAGLVLLRDLLLWTLLFAFLAVVGVFGWARLHESRKEREQQSPVLELPELLPIRADERLVETPQINTHSKPVSTPPLSPLSNPEVDLPLEFPTGDPSTISRPATTSANSAIRSRGAFKANRSTAAPRSRTRLKPVYYREK